MNRRLFGAVALATVLLLWQPGGAISHTGSPVTAEEESQAGLDERLGSKIPLDVAFRDETGKRIVLSDLITGPTIILPVYYSCSNVCNFLQGGLARVLPAVRSIPGKEYRIISVSFDENETPELAAKYKKIYYSAIQAPFPDEGWRFLTGDAAGIRRLMDAAGFGFIRKGRDFIHPVASIVVSGDGTIVRYLYGTTFLSKDISLALLEARDGTVGASIRKVVAYCFTFDPAGKTYVFNLLRVSATAVILCAGAFMLFLIVAGRRRRPDNAGRNREG